MSEIDITQDLEIRDINKITDKARELISLEMRIRRAEDQLKKDKEAHLYLSTEILPAVVKENTCADEIMFDNGFKLVVSNLITGSIPSKSSITKCKDEDQRQELSERRSGAFEWLKGHEAASIIKNTISVTVPKGFDQDKLKSLISLIDKIGLNSTQDESVHYQTLNSFIKEQLSNDESNDFPMDLFSVFCGEKAKIIAPKGFDYGRSKKD